MPTTALTIIGLTGENDLRIAMNAIQDLPCIEHVEVSLATGDATVAHTAMVSEADIRAAVEDAGFHTR
jgi:copper chaperone